MIVDLHRPSHKWSIHYKTSFDASVSERQLQKLGDASYNGEMAKHRAVTPNRRGVHSRELVLDAAERLMAEHGYEAATVAALKDKAGIPMSSIYHYFGSKDGVLLAVMERGAARFFAEVPLLTTRPRRPVEHLRVTVEAYADAVERNPDFLRLLVAMAAQPPDGDVLAVMKRVRKMALARLGDEIRFAFGTGADDATADSLGHFALAAIDGAFVAQQAEPDVSLRAIIDGLPVALLAIRRELTKQGRAAGWASTTRRPPRA
jgi:AcrR family transcriptional regulator